MKSAIIAAILVGLLAVPASSQIQSGTLIVVYFSNKQIVVAGDSLASNSSYQCKITRLGNHIVSPRIVDHTVVR